MRILHPNTGDDVVPVNRNSVFVSVVDYGLKMILKEIIIAPGQHHWEWIEVDCPNPIKPVDLSKIGDRFATFEHALNREINDPYSTVYELNNFKELTMEWEKMMYIDNIKTVYKSEDKKEDWDV